jgi:murein DD-endopeptidase MepM/ murein hydrolase activator NlpD
MSRRRTALVAAVAVASVLFAGLGAGPTGSASAAGACRVLKQSATTGAARPAVVGRWDASQLARASSIIDVGSAHHEPVRAQTVAVMAGMGLDRLGAGPGPSSRYGTRPRPGAPDPSADAAGFYAILDNLPGWDALPPSLAAHQVLGNADPNAFAGYWEDAVRVVTALTGSDLQTHYASTYGAPADSCRVFLANGSSDSYPLPAGTRYQDLTTFHPGAAAATAANTTSLVVSCGTPVLAASAGTVRVDATRAWAGRWLVRVQGGSGRPTTTYAHLRSLAVHDGEAVRAGTQIGEVGDLGATARCALGFGVKGSSSGATPANPTRWLLANAGVGAQPLRLPADFTMATFNLLGASHTGPGGNQHPGWASGAHRVPAELRLLENHGVAVAGLQEMQPSQLHAFEALAGSRWQHYPVDEKDTENSLVWRNDVFVALQKTTLPIPYFGGRIRQMPMVELRQRATGATAWFINTHNPADIGTSPHNARWRAEAIRREIAAISQLRSSGEDPVFLTGDLNDRALAFCPLTGGGLMHSASGGSGDPCSPPRHMGIDWIFATAPVMFDGFGVDTSPLHGTSDHALVYTHVTF